MTSATPDFIDCDPVNIRASIVNRYEQLTGKTLYPAQVESLLIDLIAYEKTLTHVAVQDAATQNLVAFSRAPVLDFLGELVGIYRLAARAATTIMRISFGVPLVSSAVIPAGTRFATASGISFASSAEKVVDAGSEFVDIECAAEELGIAANGFSAGQVNMLIDIIDVDISHVKNITTSFGGAIEESDERLRSRIIDAPETLSVAGPGSAYVGLARKAHQDVVDATAIGPELAVVSGMLVSTNNIPPGVVEIYVLAKQGVPNQAIIDAVLLSCSDEKKRPLTDYVKVLPCINFPYSISAQLIIYKNASAAAVLQLAHAAIDEYIAAQKSRLGKDIVPFQIEKTLAVEGVYSVNLLSPTAIVDVQKNGWSNCTAISIVVAGTKDG